MNSTHGPTQGPTQERRAIVLDLSDNVATPDADEAKGRADEIAMFCADAIAGLSQSQKSIPSKYLYDAAGARLFERITEQPEYYPTRTEIGILRANAEEIAGEIGAGSTIVEPGSGAGEKVEILLHALESPRAMVPMDIAREQLRRVARTLAARHPHLAIVPLWADFTQPVDVPEQVAALRPRLVFFPGSTIGNFLPSVQRRLLAALAQLGGEGGSLLIGFDRIKDERVLIPAYDDAAGVTREFEMNILHRLRRELNAQVLPDDFRYEARWNEAEARIEMHLVAVRPTAIVIDGQRFGFDTGQTIWNESSHKYDLPRIEALARAAGLRLERTWSDDRDYFTVALLRPAK